MNYINIIVAYSKNRVIGKDNKLIWNLPEDLKRFKKLTTGKTVIMGRKTFESIGKALPNRENIVITRNEYYIAEGCKIALSLDEAISLSTNEIFIIGGSQIYNKALDFANRIYATVIDQEFDGDSFFPYIDDSWIKLTKENNISDQFNFSYITYEKAQF